MTNIRVTFDRDYVDNLEDYYRRNECKAGYAAVQHSRDESKSIGLWDGIELEHGIH
jgi:hypothetical protein